LVPRRRAHGVGPMRGRTVRNATIRYEADLRDNDNAWLRLHYRTNGEAVDYKVQLVTTKPNYVGETSSANLKRVLIKSGCVRFRANRTSSRHRLNVRL